MADYSRSFRIEFPDGEIAEFETYVVVDGLKAVCTIASEVHTGSIYDREGAD